MLVYKASHTVLSDCLSEIHGEILYSGSRKISTLVLVEYFVWSNSDTRTTAKGHTNWR